MTAFLGFNQNTEGGGGGGGGEGKEKLLSPIFSVSEHTAALSRWQMASFRLVHFPPGSLCPGAIF